MKKLFEILFPSKADNTLRGSRIPFYLFVFTAAVWTIRSCIHIFSPHGGWSTQTGHLFSYSPRRSGQLHLPGALCSDACLLVVEY